jgi:nicotinate-nucleotide--dimethylbenzimidazole phosphoribosyltransferase
VAVSVLTNSEPVKVLARGAAATDPDAWMLRAVAVRDARRGCMPFRSEPDRLLAQLGSARLAVAAAIALRAAVRRTPVLLDGPVAAAAALIAYEAQPRAVRWWAAADLGPDPMQELALERMGRQPILGLGTGLGDGLAAMLAVPAIHAANALGR